MGPILLPVAVPTGLVPSSPIASFRRMSDSRGEPHSGPAARGPTGLPTLLPRVADVMTRHRHARNVAGRPVAALQDSTPLR